ncbi:ribosome small subunit-dependent GTPase A [Gracilimonas halophila]|uniref:Small ribosomal subunit biogenesis GTPase RsgA n=1 Tax=Gracilimonas halophila TaxID=1834464 RepID=A0ABW5JIZ9_9BACT
MQKGRVIQSTGSWYLIDTGEKVVESRLPGRFRLENKQVTNPIAVGDLVDIVINDDASGSIEKIHPRENYITRQATHSKKGEQILVSNLDQACVVQSIKKPRVKEGFIDRFLVTCEAYEVKPVIIINKMDLAKSGGKAFAEELRELYTELGYEFLTTSIQDEESLKKLKELLKEVTSAFIGPSGVGKTSLINAIDPSFDLKVNEVSDFSNKGKHTTTFARLIPLSFGGYIADTPGIREFGLVNIQPWELSLFFPEMLEPRQHCQFSNCTHAHEPKCGVAEAFERGEIAASRYQSYLNMLDSL